jgi:hypothetical protein
LKAKIVQSGKVLQRLTTFDLLGVGGRYYRVREGGQPFQKVVYFLAFTIHCLLSATGMKMAKSFAHSRVVPLGIQASI